MPSLEAFAVPAVPARRRPCVGSAVAPSPEMTATISTDGPARHNRPTDLSICLHCLLYLTGWDVHGDPGRLF